MAFVPPTWIEGLMYYAMWTLLPFVIGIVLFGIGALLDRDKYEATNRQLLFFGGGIIFIILAVLGCVFLADVGWHYQVETESVQEKLITVDDWQPIFGHYWGDVQSADDLMLKTTDGELFINKENFLFQKFNTRDILDQLKPNGTYKIKYYGWREGYNNGCPNILSVEQVVDESNCPNHHDISNYMNKRSIIYADDDDMR